MILITGSCGSIGSALCENFNLMDVIRLDIKETNGEMVDIQNFNEVERVIKKYKPTTVIHAAANKYVDYLENNIEEAININVLGTRNIVRICSNNNVSKMLLISTDKANNPASVLGYSKRAAEIYTLLSGYSVIKLVNVYESSGNVIEIFKKQIENNQPVTVTDPRMTRYFVKIEDVCKSIITSIYSSYGKDIFFVPGKLTKIIDLAYELIGEKEITIKITQPRPGDKIEEENPIPKDAIQINQNLWRTFFDRNEDAEKWIDPLILNKNLSTLIDICK